MPDGATRQTRKKAKYQRRQIEVFDAAAAVFAEKGYHGASTGDIAAKLGIAQSSLYYYVKSKDEALEKICLESMKGYVERLQLIATSDQPADEKIRQAIRNHIDPIKTIPDYFQAFVGELRYLPKSKRRKLDAKITEYNALFGEIVTQGIADRVFSAALDSHSSALMIIAQCNWMPFWLKQSNGFDLDKIATQIADNFLLGALQRDH